MGATFAYFTASNTVNTTLQGATDTQLTKKLGGATFTSSKVTFGAKGEKIGALDYPGGSMIIGTTYTISEKGEDDANDYIATFKLGVAGLNTTGQTVNWYLVRSDKNPVESLESQVSCTLNEEKDGTVEDGNTMKYWYSDCTAKDLFGNEGPMASLKLVAYGTINPTASQGKEADSAAEATAGNIKETEEQTTAGTPFESQVTPEKLSTAQTLTTKSGGVSTATYYLVVEFPNTEGKQDEAQGTVIKASLVAPTSVETDLDDGE